MILSNFGSISRNLGDIFQSRGETLSEVEIEDIKQSKYSIIHDLLEAFVGKLRKLLDCEDVM